MKEKERLKRAIKIKGTHCPSCKAVIEDVCKDMKGIIACKVDFKTGKTVVEHDGTVDWQGFKKEIDSLGEYEVQLKE